MNSALFNLMLTQFRQYIREPQILFWSFGFPLLLVWLLGLSFSSQDIPERRIGIVMPQDQTAAAQVREWSEQLAATDHQLQGIVNLQEVKRQHLIKVKYLVSYYQNRDEVILALKRGDIQMFVEVIPQQTGQKRIYYLDPQDNEAMLSYYLMNEKEQGERQPTEKNLSVLETAGLRYVDFLVPGLLAMAIMETCLIAVGWALVEKRITRVTRQMCITPMRKSTFLMAHIGACFLINFIEILIINLFARVYFDVEIQGSFSAFLLLLFAGNVCFSGVAVLASSRAMKAQTANGLLEVTILVQVLFSGIFFSYKNFPHWMVSIIEYLPLTMLADAMRKVFIEGGDIRLIMPATLMLMGFGVFTFVLGMRIFRWH
ncbi:ABC transporter permease [Serratia plymuthica]|uniref:ABC transporter permease n=1 Tax=Serratia plymuthica TaxID=82996 RepID=UPI0004566103|nr:ABC transporter permease [Serratia plymuthica]AHY09199.1 ABC transporter [Serratia plymuthica]MBL3525608.1 ABC transporter permease [Serratia plymuthica]MEB6540893.1 ABC transporter permease [Serratia plymuthica]QPS86759.1 ABC transporter permease [Serratia plymuthica]